MRDAYWYAVDDYALTVMESILHTAAYDVVAAENKAIQNKGTKRHGADKSQETQNIFQGRVLLCECWFCLHRFYFSISSANGVVVIE